MIEAVTIGPIPSEIKLPNSAPRIIDKYSNCDKEFCPSGQRGIRPKTKNRTSTRRVHFSLSLKGSLFCLGDSTSGRLIIILSKKLILVLKKFHYYLFPSFCSM